MRYISTQRRLFLRGVVLVVGSLLLVGTLSSPATAQTPLSFKRIHTDLCNFDLRVPNIPGLINDLEIVIYGIFPGGVADVVSTFPNPLWGLPKVEYVPGWKGNPQHPGYGFDQLIIRYGWWTNNPTVPVAPPGSPMHFGIHLRPCRLHVHMEAWWTFNGQRVARAWLCHIYKIQTPVGWLVRVSNPRVWDPDFPDKPLIIHDARFFTPAASSLPRLEDLVSGIEPKRFGTDDWTVLQDGDLYPTTLELEPDMVVTFRIPYPTPIPAPPPPVFQIQLDELTQGTGNSPSSAVPPPLAVVTDRAAVELEGDLNGDGVVGLPDFNALRTQFGQSSPDESP